jgi:hypothetical protein
MGANCRPCSFEQFWIWVDRYMNSNKRIHFVGLSAICWEIWKIRNAIHFEKKQVKSPNEIICLASSFLTYWAGCQKRSTNRPWKLERRQWRKLLYTSIQCKTPRLLTMEQFCCGEQKKLPDA